MVKIISNKKYRKHKQIMIYFYQERLDMDKKEILSEIEQEKEKINILGRSL